MKPTSRAPAYAMAYHGLAETARNHGYALTIHGSLQKDLDLVAIPWTENPSPAHVVAEAIRDHAGAVTSDFSQVKDWKNPEPRPHGRLVWHLGMDHGAYIDLSVMPIQVRCELSNETKEFLRAIPDHRKPTEQGGYTGPLEGVLPILHGDSVMPKKLVLDMAKSFPLGDHKCTIDQVSDQTLQSCIDKFQNSGRGFKGSPFPGTPLTTSFPDPKKDYQGEMKLAPVDDTDMKKHAEAIATDTRDFFARMAEMRHPLTCGNDRSDAAHTAYQAEHGGDFGELVEKDGFMVCPVCGYKQKA